MWEDGRALVPPQSTNIDSADKVLSMQIEETSEGRRVQVFATCTNGISTDEASTMPIEETISLTNVDASGKP